MKEELEIMDGITERLSQLCLMDWVPVVRKWLAHYRGFCEFCCSVAPRQLPAYYVLRLLESYEAPPDNARLSHDLARLDFLAQRVGHIGERDVWNPQVESLPEFMSRGPCTCWGLPTEYPSPDVTERKLLQALHDGCRKECGLPPHSH